MNKALFISILCINFTGALLTGPREMARKIATEATKTTARKYATAYVATSIAFGTAIAITHPSSSISTKNETYHLDRIQNFALGASVPTYIAINAIAYPPYLAYKKLTSNE